jgi:hypothetical protein
MPIFIPEALTALSSVAFVVALLGLILAIVALRRVAEERRHYTALMTGVDGADIAAALESYVRRLNAADERLSALEGHSSELDQRLRAAVQRVALHRYSAFADSGGDQSFSLALLDDAVNGVVVSGLYGRGGMRMYAKPILAGESNYTLTQEEQGVLAEAVGSGAGR